MKFEQQYTTVASIYITFPLIVYAIRMMRKALLMCDLVSKLKKWYLENRPIYILEYN